MPPLRYATHVGNQTYDRLNYEELYNMTESNNYRGLHNRMQRNVMFDDNRFQNS